MKKQLVTALLLTTSIATFTESYAADATAGPQSTRTERLAALKAKAAERQRAIEERTADIEANARSIADDRQQIAVDTDSLEKNLGAIDEGTASLEEISEKGKMTISEHARAFNDIKDSTKKMLESTNEILKTLDETIENKGSELDAAIRAGADDIAEKRAELQQLEETRSSITGQVDNLIYSVKLITDALKSTA